MVATSMAYYAIPLVSVMFAGRLGDLQLAAATLGNSWGTVTGIALMVRTPHTYTKFNQFGFRITTF